MTQKILRELSHPSLANRLSHIRHQCKQEIQVMRAQQHVRKDFIRLNQVAQIGSTELPARAAPTSGINWPRILCILGVP